MVLVAGVSAKRAGLTLRHGLFLGLHTSSRSSHSDSTLSALDALDTSALQNFRHWDTHNLFPDAFRDSLRGDLIDGTVFRSVTESRESAHIAPAVPPVFHVGIWVEGFRFGLSWIGGGLVNVFLSPSSVAAS